MAVPKKQVLSVTIMKSNPMAGGCEVAWRGSRVRSHQICCGPSDSALAKVAPPIEGSFVITPDASRVGAQLDEHHAPETNGRMAVCRRCGAMTDSPVGCHHVPGEPRLARLSEWLDAQERIRIFERARDRLKN